MARFLEVPENEIEFDSFINFPVSIFRLELIEIERKEFEELSIGKRSFAYVKEVYWRFSLSTIFVTITSFIINSVVNSDNLALSSQCILYAIVCSQVVFRVITTLNARKDILKIFQEMRIISKSRTELNSKELNSKYEIKTYLERYLLLMKLYAMSFVLTCSSVASSVFNFLFFGNMKLAVNYWYPFNVNTVKTFPIALIWVNWSVWNASIYLLAVDSLLYGLITVLAMEFDILKADVSGISFAPDDGSVDRVIEFCKRHNKLIELSDRLQYIYGSNFAFNLVTSSAMICFSLFQLTVAESNLETYAFFIPYSCLLMGQIFLLCFFGQKLIDSSSDVADGIFNSKWTDHNDIQTRKHFVLMIQQAQRGKHFSAMGFVDISLETFNKVFTLIKILNFMY